MKSGLLTGIANNLYMAPSFVQILQRFKGLLNPTNQIKDLTNYNTNLQYLGNLSLQVFGIRNSERSWNATRPIIVSAG